MEYTTIDAMNDNDDIAIVHPSSPSTLLSTTGTAADVVVGVGGAPGGDVSSSSCLSLSATTSRTASMIRDDNHHFVDVTPLDDDDNDQKPPARNLNRENYNNTNCNTNYYYNATPQHAHAGIITTAGTTTTTTPSLMIDLLNDVTEHDSTTIMWSNNNNNNEKYSSSGIIPSSSTGITSSDGGNNEMQFFQQQQHHDHPNNIQQQQQHQDKVAVVVVDVDNNIVTSSSSSEESIGQSIVVTTTPINRRRKQQSNNNSSSFTAQQPMIGGSSYNNNNPETIDVDLEPDVVHNMVTLGSSTSTTTNMMVTANRPRKRTKIHASSSSSLPSSSSAGALNRDAIEVDMGDDSTTALNQSPTSLEDIYKQSLGPYRFEFVPLLQGHAFANEKLPASVALHHKLYKELVEFKLNLPIQPASSIFVRALESRCDVLRAIITGPDDTPYANGIFMFDLFLHDYPNSPPKVKFLTTGGGRIRFNPNLYQCGKVCLSILGTWTGPGWIPKKSTLLQVLVSIQSLVLVTDPYFNEPGAVGNSSHHRAGSNKYNRETRKSTLRYAILDVLRLVTAAQDHQNDENTSTNGDADFHHVIREHFLLRTADIENQLKQWIKEGKEHKNEMTKMAEEVRTLLKTLSCQKKSQLEKKQLLVSTKAVVHPPEIIILD